MFLSSPIVLPPMKTSVSLVLSRCQKRQSRLIFNPYSRLTMRPSSTPPHPYWPAQLNPFNVPLRNDTFPTAELPTSTSLSFCFQAWCQVDAGNDRARGWFLPRLSPENVQNPVLDPLSSQHFSHSGYHRLFSANQSMF